MKRHFIVLLLAALPLAGCDAAKDPYARAAAAEAEGKLGEARTLYGEACAKAASSPLCTLAKSRAEALSVREAYQALDAGEFGKAKELFTNAAAAESPAVKAAAAVGLEDEELKAALALEDAQKADKAAARGAMEGLAAGHTKAAPKAREWLAKNGPSMLLEEIKAACKQGGTGSCVELGEKMADLYPQSPEAAEAQRLVDEDYERIRKRLGEAEGLLVQRYEVALKKAKYDACVAEASSPQPEESCLSALELPPSDPFATRVIDKAFDTKLGEIGDAGYVARFRERYKRVEDKTEHDFTTWTKRGDKKK
ncbi:hypothetical protein [Polyangium aurulentum]|uniref:hypothetical protein n=1 Tax=Polyangium aurulentum TaxID=2567896 RepID=UPI0010AE456C|nr:hypothetical protein [Polyangium aurulentum]UQA62465.1 hypothetical protein E8A73_019195 [Polyangium aurulentum]